MPTATRHHRPPRRRDGWEKLLRGLNSANSHPASQTAATWTRQLALPVQPGMCQQPPGITDRRDADTQERVVTRLPCQQPPGITDRRDRAPGAVRPHRIGVPTATRHHRPPRLAGHQHHWELFNGVPTATRHHRPPRHVRGDCGVACGACANSHPASQTAATFAKQTDTSKVRQCQQPPGITDRRDRRGRRMRRRCQPGANSHPASQTAATMSGHPAPRRETGRANSHPASQTAATSAMAYRHAAALSCQQPPGITDRRDTPTSEAVAWAGVCANSHPASQTAATVIDALNNVVRELCQQPPGITDRRDDQEAKP